jgi:hypothetical protein
VRLAKAARQFLCGDIPLSYLEPNLSADKTLSVLVELIKSGRYTPTSSISKLLDDAKAIKGKIEELYSDKS